jgi:hypothetical protein
MMPSQEASPTAAVLGEIGLPEPIAQLASRAWDAIIAMNGRNAAMAVLKDMQRGG